jgi:hypothetical protein
VLNAGRADAVGDVHADDAANYTGATATTTITVLKASTHDQLVGAGGHHLRHGAERDAAERDGERAGAFVYSPAPAPC